MDPRKLFSDLYTRLLYAQHKRREKKKQGDGQTTAYKSPLIDMVKNFGKYGFPTEESATRYGLEVLHLSDNKVAAMPPDEIMKIYPREYIKDRLIYVPIYAPIIRKLAEEIADKKKGRLGVLPNEEVKKYHSYIDLRNTFKQSGKESFVHAIGAIDTKGIEYNDIIGLNIDLTLAVCDAHRQAFPDTI